MHQALKRQEGDFSSGFGSLSHVRDLSLPLFAKSANSLDPVLPIMPRALERVPLAVGIPDCPLAAVQESFELRELRLNKFQQALAARQNQADACQQGTLINLDLVSPKETFFVGDLHARLDNLAAILSHEGLWHKVSSGQARLVFLGDIIHNEHSNLLSDMTDSYRMQQWLMELTVAAPNSVFQLLGNHDFCRNGVIKHNIQQGLLYLNELEKCKGEVSDERVELYIKQYQEAIESLPLVLVSSQIVACHAGPIGMESFLLDVFPSVDIKADFLESLACIDVTDAPFYEQSQALRQATWSRPNSISPMNGDLRLSYSATQVKDFLGLCEKPEATFLSGHSIGFTRDSAGHSFADLDNSAWQTWPGEPRCIILHSGLNRPAYIKHSLETGIDVIYPPID